MAHEDTRPETKEPEVRDVPSVEPAPEVKPTPAADTTSKVEPPKLTEPAEPHAAAPGKRSGFVPLLLGGVLAAVLGFGLARAVPGGWPVQDVEPLRAEIQRQAQEITALRDRIGALAIPNLAPLEQRVNSLEQGTQTADLQAQIDELRSQIGNGQISSDLQAAVDQTKQQLADARAEAENLQKQAAETARAATLAAARTRIAGALDSGTAYNAALQDLRDANVEVPQPLADGADGVPSLAALRADFPEAARAALQASLRAEDNAGIGSQFGAFLRAQTGARSLEPREGNGPDAILSRAEAAVNAGDLQRALDEIGNLSLEGQAALSEWRARAEQRIAAVEALAQLNAGSR